MKWRSRTGADEERPDEMSSSAETERAVVTPLIVAERKGSARARARSLFAGEQLSAINLCFIATTVAGCISEYYASPIAAVVSMLIYFGAGFVFRGQVRNTERFADSLYYQGFILTLFALLLALAGDGTNKLTSEGIIQQFGLAIWTTFVGMTGRILIIQFTASAGDSDEEVKDSISRYVVALNREVKTALDLFRAFRESVLIQADKLTEESKRGRRESDEAITDAIALIASATEKAVKKVDESVEALTSRIANLEIPTSIMSDHIRGVATTMRADLEQLRWDMDTSTTEYARTLRDNAAILLAAQSDLDLLRRSLTDVNRIVADSIRTTTESLNTTHASLESSAKAALGVERLGLTAEASAIKLFKLTTALDAKARSYADEVNRYRNEIEKTNSELTKVAAEAREGASGLAVAVVEGAQKLTDAVREVRRLDEGPQ